MKVLLIIVALFFIPVSADASNFWTKLIYAGHDSQESWEQAQKDKFLEQDKPFAIQGNYAYTKVGGEVVITNKTQLINAYKRGGKDAVVELIGKDASAQLQFDEDINEFSDGNQLVNQVKITDKGREFIANSAEELNDIQDSIKAENDAFNDAIKTASEEAVKEAISEGKEVFGVIDGEVYADKDSFNAAAEAKGLPTAN